MQLVEVCDVRILLLLKVAILDSTVLHQATHIVSHSTVHVIAVMELRQCFCKWEEKV